MRLFFSILVCIASQLALGAPAQAVQSMPEELWNGDYPGGPFAYVLVQPPRIAVDPAWATRTGIRKGVFSQAVEDELFAGPDIAVLKGGLFGQWPGLLAGFQEAAIIVEPWDIGGLAQTKPILIIPTGGLAGLSESLFFKAGLGAYVEAGGVLVVMSQRKGSDYSILPVPRESRLEVSGWLEDPIAFFRSSSVQSAHPVLAGIRTDRPAIETHGYIRSHPPGATVLLARADGKATALLYPLGKGWVAVTTFFSDFSFSQNTLDAEEQKLLRDILAWAKAPASVTKCAPGDIVTSTLAIKGPEHGDAASVKILVMGPDRARPVDERVIPLKINAGETLALPFKYAVPPALQPGIHHLEYLLLDAKGAAVSDVAEEIDGRFYLGQPALPIPIKQAYKPTTGAPLRLALATSLERRGETIAVALEISREPRSPAQDLVIRFADKEKSVAVAQDTITISFDVTRSYMSGIIGAAIYDAQGRSLLRTSIPVSETGESGPALSRPFYAPGAPARIAAHNMGKGELSFTGAGAMANAMIAGRGFLDFTIPSPLPMGIYPALWEFQSISAPLQSGEIPVHVAGYSAIFEDAVIAGRTERKSTELSSTFRLRSTHAFAGRLRLWLRSPDGTIIETGEKSLDVAQGEQTILFSFPFSPKISGIWDLRYGLFAIVPEGPGMPSKPLCVAGGRKLIDAGDAAILGVTTTAPVYYEPAGARDATIHVAGIGKVRIELEVDGRRVAREKRELAGYSAVPVPLPQLAQGRRRIAASVMGDGGDSKYTREIVYGARLPDLTISLAAPAPTDSDLPISVTIVNNGKRRAQQSSASLHDGPSPAKGALLSKIDTPPLEPGGSFTAIVKWPLRNKAGTRGLTAITDADDSVLETDERNNTASLSVTVPDFLLFAKPIKKQLNAAEPLAVTVTVVNLTADKQSGVSLRTSIIDPAGGTAASETIPVPNIAGGADTVLERTIAFQSSAPGSYRILAELLHNSAITSAASEVVYEPTLLLSGTLEHTADRAILCRPFAIRFAAANIGNLPVTSGSLTIELKSAEGQIVYVQQLPYAPEARSLDIEQLLFPAGSYTLTLKASVMNGQYAVNRDLTLAERPLIITGPLEIKRASSSVPRVLIWSGGTDSSVEQAALADILRHALDQNSMTATTVNTGEEFLRQAASGRFQAHLMIEPTIDPGNLDALQRAVGLGQGLVIIGSHDQARAVAETFGFYFDKRQATGAATLVLGGDLDLGITGTMPVSGLVFLPRKSGAKSAARYAGGEDAAMLIDRAGGGALVVLPLSLARSAVDAGSSSLYGLLVRSAIQAAIPGKDGAGSALLEELTVHSESGPVIGKIKATLPPGSSIVQTSAGGEVNGSTITFPIALDQEPQQLTFLHQPPADEPRPPVVEAFFECNGKLMSQGRIE